MTGKEMRYILDKFDETRAEHPEISYTDEKLKVIAELRSHKSAVYTKLADRLESIDRMEAQIKEYKLEMKAMTREHVADLFDAEDAVKTRVIDTVSFIITLTKTPTPTVSYQYAKILAELANHLTPELLIILNDLKEKFKSESQREPGISIVRKEVEESVITDKLKHYFAKFKRFILHWAHGYDRRLNALKKHVMMNESLLVEFIELDRLKNEFKKEFWYCVEETPTVQLWVHMDDPSIGSYQVHLSPDGTVEKIEYKHPLSSIFNRTFDSPQMFLKHLYDTTYEEISPESLEKGRQQLKKIADVLKKQERRKKFD